MPEEHRNVLLITIAFLQKFIAPEIVSVTKMTIENISAIFAPCFFRSPFKEMDDILKAAENEKHFVVVLIKTLDTSKFTDLVNESPNFLDASVRATEYKSEKEISDQIDELKVTCRPDEEVNEPDEKQAYEENKEHISEYQKKYKKEHPEVHRIANQRRSALKRNLPATLTAEQWEQIKSVFSNTCAYCGKESKLAQEHFTPLSKGGHYTKENIIPACRSCNCSKNNRDFFEWYPQQEFYSQERELFIIEHLISQQEEQQEEQEEQEEKEVSA
jgi:5-methylcytosine-specific restriction endonuclease McrA